MSNIIKVPCRAFVHSVRRSWIFVSGSPICLALVQRRKDAYACALECDNTIHFSNHQFNINLLICTGAVTRERNEERHKQKAQTKGSIEEEEDFWRTSRGSFADVL